MKTLALVALSLLAVAWVGATAKTPQEIFADGSPSIVVVAAYGDSGSLEEIGSGVVIAPGQVITNCHVAKEGANLRIKQGGAEYSAIVHYADRERDLCQLSVPKLNAPVVAMGNSTELRQGARVVAIGAPEGLELTISEGLISGLHPRDGSKIIQTSAAISPGSSGGGLFDDGGRLIGITTAFLAEGQNLNFALPVSWISALPVRSHTKAAQKQTVDWDRQERALKEKKDWQGVLALARRRTQMEPQVAASWIALGWAFENLHRPAEQVDAYLQATKIDPDNSDAWFYLGGIYGEIGEYYKAYSAEYKAAHLSPTSAHKWSGMGAAAAAICNDRGLNEAYQSLLKLDSEKAMRLSRFVSAPTCTPTSSVLPHGILDWKRGD